MLHKSLINHSCVLQKKNATTIAVEVKKSQHKYVIGPKGNTLQEILDRTGVSVEIPPSDSSSETVILRGEPDRLGQALTEVYAKVKWSCENCWHWLKQWWELPFLTNNFLFAGKQLHYFLGNSSFLASSFHYRQEGPELSQDYSTNAQGLLNGGFLNCCA